MGRVPNGGTVPRFPQVFPLRLTGALVVLPDGRFGMGQRCRHAALDLP